MSAWLSAKRAYEHVLAIELAADSAASKLTKRVRNGEIPGRNGEGEIVLASVWKKGFLRIDFEKGEAIAQVHPIYQGQDISHTRTHLTGLQFSSRHLYSIWPVAAAEVTAPPPYRTGAQGRPTSGHLVEAEYRRRRAAGEPELDRGAEAKVLQEWLQREHPLAPPVATKTMTNYISRWRRAAQKS